MRGIANTIYNFCTRRTHGTRTDISPHTAQNLRRFGWKGGAVDCVRSSGSTARTTRHLDYENGRQGDFGSEVHWTRAGVALTSTALILSPSHLCSAGAPSGGGENYMARGCARSRPSFAESPPPSSSSVGPGCGCRGWGASSCTATAVGARHGVPCSLFARILAWEDPPTFWRVGAGYLSGDWC